MDLDFCLVLYISRVTTLVWSSIDEVRLARRKASPGLSEQHRAALSLLLRSLAGVSILT
jgi:hypothetical protein